MKVPPGLPSEEWVKPIEKGDPAPEAGIVVSEAHAWRDAQFRLAYKSLRDIDRADRSVWPVHRQFYEERVATSKKELERLQPTWWDRNVWAIGLAVGFLAGAAATVGIAAALDHALQPVK